MKSILVTYPDFRSLPKGIKRLLVTSESLFFDAANATSKSSAGREPITSDSRDAGGRAWPAPDLTWLQFLDSAATNASHRF